MKEQKYYSVALRKRENKDDFFWKNCQYRFADCQIDCLNRYWIADPFLYIDTKSNVTYLFYEAYDLIELKGKIGYSVINNGVLSPVTIIINENFHLSFPNIYDLNGERYIIPESCKNHTVSMYRAVNFPDEWELCTDILPDIYACDSVLIDGDEKRYLICSEMYYKTPTGVSPACWIKNRLYELSPEFNCRDEGKIIDEGDMGVRNAGKIFEYEGKLIRVGQDCTDNMYGKGIVFFNIESISPYREKKMLQFDYSDFQEHIDNIKSNDIAGVHTYNFCDTYEVIDYSYKIPEKISVRLKRMLFRMSGTACL